MASVFRWEINKVTTNGNYTYIIFKDGVGLTSVNALSTVTAALNGVRDDIGAALGGETVTKISAQTFTS